MRVTIPHFDLQLNADSGQCFRMRPVSDGLYRIIVGGHVLHLKEIAPHTFEADCNPQLWSTFWAPYLDLETDYQAICALVPETDRFLSAATAYGAGLRIFQQDPWETLISFIISQRKTVPAIMHCVEALSRAFGSPLDNGLHAFPTPEQLAAQTLDSLNACGLGYRSRYIVQTARMVASGQVDLPSLADLTDEELMQSLTALPGVGVKVASCVALFGYHRLHYFPRDVWILRVEQEHYGGRFPEENYPGVAGVLQQHMFCFRRSPAYRLLQPALDHAAHPSSKQAAQNKENT